MGLKEIIPNITDEEIVLVNKIENTRERINEAREYGDDTQSLYDRMRELKEDLEVAKAKRRATEN
jgi:hypothetical protein